MVLDNPLVRRIHARRSERQRNALFVGANLLFILTCVGYAVQQAFA